MAHVVVLGAGLGGVIMAYEMRDQLRRGDKLTVVTKEAKYHFVPSNPWVAVNWRKRADIEIDLKKTFAKRGIDFKPVAAAKVHAKENTLELVDGSSLPYDFLVIATGPELAFDEIEGLGPMGPYALGLPRRPCRTGRRGIEEFCNNPGPIITARLKAPPASARLRVHLHPRNRAAPPQDSRQGADDLRHLRALYRPSGPGRRGRHQRHSRSAMREKHIKWICNARMKKAEAAR